MIELWGGVECTRARIGDAFRDQSDETGHTDRPEDLDRIAELGLRTLRYPILWETVSPNGSQHADFSWHDPRIAHLGRLGIGIIAGLCHHGSGPAHTNLLDPEWPALLAEHAGRVAERYPHIDRYTPVNEPLTTARFSCLYGHWYPHLRTYRAFLPALVNQCKATVLAMRAIRKIQPGAMLVQTDDFGKTFSTPALALQAEHENQRRWLTFDLLCGRVDRHHPWWPIMLSCGVEEADLALLLEGDAAPDIIGINHYLTSERYLDEALHRYPESHWGGNGRQRYADAEAVRLPIPHEDLGPAARLREVWERYHLPVAVTEVHHGCSRDDQLRWLAEVWKAAATVRAEGADIRAVTVWSLFGTVDWNSLLTRREGCYEPGAFDVRGPAPRPTILAAAASRLAKGDPFDHPVLDRAGWWKRQERFYRHVHRGPATCRLVGSPRELLIAGGRGTLGRAFSRICNARGLDHSLVGRAEMDITDPARVAAALDRARPWAVINAAGFVRPPGPDEEARCMRENAHGARMLAQACAERGIPFLTYSSDLVFDGTKGIAYDEGDRPNAVCAYGASKVDAERGVLEAYPQSLVVRSSAFFGPWDRHNFVWALLESLAAGRRFRARADVVSPTYVPDLVHESLNLLIDGAEGVWHLSHPASLSWIDLARRAATMARLDPELVEPEEVLATGREPRNTTLTSARGIMMPPLDGALDRFFRDAEIGWAQETARAAG
jgi:dTDP-4-dehydrorhamnose reductase